MSDESISMKEDKENLLYIARKIHVQELVFGEESSYLRESLQHSDSSEEPFSKTDSFAELFENHKSVGPQLLNDPEIVAKTCPFELKWFYGLNPGVRIRNLTTYHRTQILCSSSHIPVLLDYCKKEMKYLPGHSTTIIDLASNGNGDYLATLEVGPNGCLVIWENKDTEVTPIFTVYEICTVAMCTVRLSNSGKLLVTVGEMEDCYKIHFWWWTYGTFQPDDSYDSPKSRGPPCSIIINSQCEDHVMVTFHHQIVFVTLDSTTRKIVKSVAPTIPDKKKIGHVTDGVYATNCHECFGATDKGYVLIFGNTLYPKPYEKGELLDNSKIFRNSARICPCSITYITSCDEIIVTGDVRGYMHFFDKKMRILYWMRDFHISNIIYITFSLRPKIRDYSKVTSVRYIENKLSACNVNDVDIVDEIEAIIKKPPTDASLERNIFLIRDCFILTQDTRVYAVDAVNSTCTLIFKGTPPHITAIDTHDKKSYIAVGLKDGVVELKDFITDKEVSCITLPQTEDERDAVTAIKYSVESLHLVCGRENGEIWILEPILLTPKIQTPFCPTNNKILKIDFSSCPLQFAYYDVNRTVVLFSYDVETQQWMFSGKIRPHYEDISDLAFLPGVPYHKLYTISKDRNIIEYNNDKFKTSPFDIVSRDRIEQSSQPLCFTHWMEEFNGRQTQFILVADNKHKFKFLIENSKMPKALVLGPAFGCFKNQPITKMKILPGCDSRYMLFSTEKHIGLHLFPPDGNPYKYVGYLAHPFGLGDFAVSHDGQFVFTFGAVDGCLFKWEIKTKGVDLMAALGGKELEPWYCLIEGGRNGWLLNEIKDLFYYMQILQQENKDMPRRVTDSIPITDIPDLVRTCGFYPSEFELENMMIDVKLRNGDQTEKLMEDINFIDFVKLYCNHKPVYGYSLQEIENAFKTLAEATNSNDLNREDFLHILTNCGEPLTATNAFKCLKALMTRYDTEENFNFLPETISFQFLCDDILGIDMQRGEALETEEIKENVSDDETDS